VAEEAGREVTAAAVYARKSTDGEAGVERQVSIAKDFITARGWSVGPVFQDNNVSGSVFDRPGLNALVAAVFAHARAFDRLVVMDASRLGRDMVETLALQMRLTGAGVRIFHYQDGQELLVGTPTQKLVATVGNYGHEDFRYQVKLNTTKTLRFKAESGHVTGAQTYGYRFVHRGVGKGKHGADKHTHVEREVVPAEAAVVRRVFEMSAAGHGDRRISHALLTDGVPAAGKTGWSKDVVRRMLGNRIYEGVVLYGVRTATAERPPVEAHVPALRLVDGDLWARAQARKVKTRAHYLRDARGHLLGKPEAGLVAKFLLSGIARCWSCGGALTAVKKQRDRARYYCSARYSRGAAFCPNSHGVPLAPLDESVRDALRALLTERPDAVAALCEERDARLRAEQATAGDTREQAMVEAAGLEKEIGRLVKALASGAASEDVTAAITERRTKVEALKATPAPAAPWDRAAFFRRFAGVRKVAMLIDPHYPAQARQVLRKLGVEKIVVTQDGDGWVFEGSADLAPYLGAEPLVAIGSTPFSARPGVPVE
jgi:DNA invertase Pin-like site-specific DNA recombinase